MSRKAEKVFTYNLNLLGSVVDGNGQLIDPAVDLKHVFTVGKNVYVATAACLHKFQWIGEEAGHDYNMLEFDELNYHLLNNKIKYSGSVKVPNGIAWISRAYSNTYISNTYYNWTSFSKVNNTTFEITVFNTPTTMISNLLVDNGKLWCVGSSPTDQGLTTSDLNRLYIWNPTNNTWASVEIPVKKQVTKCQIAAGNDGYIYVTNFNNFSVTRFSNITGAFDQTFRTNGYPMSVCGIPDRGVVSGSYAGMLTKIDGVTGEVFNAHSTIDPAIQLLPQGNDYIWFLKITNEGKIWDDEEVDEEGQDNNDGKVQVCRLTRSDNEVVIINEDFTLTESPDPTLGTPISIDVSKPFKYKQFNGTDWYEVNAIPHLFIIDDAKKLFMLKLDDTIMVKHTLTLESYSMISTGPQDYMGEIAPGEA